MSKKSDTQPKEGLPVIPVAKVYDEAAVKIYELLFCDNIELYGNMKDVFPALFVANPSPEELLELARDKNVESRIRILAYRRLKELQVMPDTKEVLGVIVEYNQSVNNGKGLDTLAVYSDGNVRYINYTSRMAILPVESSIPQLQKLIQDIFKQAGHVAQAIGPWEKRRLPPPATDYVRLSLLVNGDIYFGQGPSQEMFHDNLAGSLLQNMAMLLQGVIHFGEPL